MKEILIAFVAGLAVLAVAGVVTWLWRGRAKPGDWLAGQMADADQTERRSDADELTVLRSQVLDVARQQGEVIPAKLPRLRQPDPRYVQRRRVISVLPRLRHLPAGYGSPSRRPKPHVSRGGSRPGVEVDPREVPRVAGRAHRVAANLMVGPSMPPSQAPSTARAFSGSPYDCESPGA